MCTVYDRIFNDFPAQKSVYTTYMYGSGQPYICTKHAVGLAQEFSCLGADLEVIEGLKGFRDYALDVLENNWSIYRSAG
jgi:hypothetical protein